MASRTSVALGVVLAFVGVSSAAARIDPRTFFDGTWAGDVVNDRPFCAGVAPSHVVESHTFTIARRGSRLVLTETGSTSVCDLTPRSDRAGIDGVAGHCEIGGRAVTLTMLFVDGARRSLRFGARGTDEGRDDVGQPLSCPFTLEGTITRSP